MEYKQEIENIKRKFLEYKDKTLKLTTERNTLEKDLVEWSLLSKDIDSYISQYQNIPFPTKEEKRKLESWLQQKLDSLELINTYANRFEEINQQLELVSDNDLNEQAEFIKNIDKLKDTTNALEDIENTSEKLKTRDKNSKKLIKVLDYQGQNKKIYIDLVEDYKKLTQVKSELLKKNNESYKKLILQAEDTKEVIDQEKVIYEKKFIDKKLNSMTDEEKVFELENRINYIANTENHKNTGPIVNFKYEGKTIKIPLLWKDKLFLYNLLLEKTKTRISEKAIIASKIKNKLNNNIVSEEKKQDALAFINSLRPEFAETNQDFNITNQDNENYLYSSQLKQEQTSIEYEDLYSNIKNNKEIKILVKNVRKLRKGNKIKELIKRTSKAIISNIIMITTGNTFISYGDEKELDFIEDVKENRIQIGNLVKIYEGTSIYKSASDSILEKNKYKPYFGYSSERLIIAVIVEYQKKQYNINAKQKEANKTLNNMVNQGGQIISVLTANQNINWDGKRILSNEEYSYLTEGWFNADDINIKERSVNK